jgi:hypothetical protein
MLRKKYLLLGVSIALVFSITFKVNELIKFNNTSSESLSTEITAEEKIKELNARIDSGEEHILTMDAMFPLMSEDELIRESDFIVLGKVKDLEKEYMLNEDIPFSEFSFEVKKYIKAPVEDIKNTSLTVTQDGNLQFEFDGHPLLQKEKDYILFLKKHNENNTTKLLIVGGPNGKIDVANNKINQFSNLLNSNGMDVSNFISKIKIN